MSEWRSTNDPPGWREGGLVEMKRRNGSTAKGWINFDVDFDGEDEIPIIELSINGQITDFFSFAEWRQLQDE